MTRSAVALAICAACAGTLTSLVALWQGTVGFAIEAERIASSSLPIREGALSRLRSGRVFGTLLLPASLGGALAVTVPISAALFTRSGRRGRLVVGSALVVQAAALIWTFSLGAWLSLSAAVLAIYVCSPRFTARHRRRALAATVIVAALLAGGFFVRRALLPVPGIEDRPLAYRAGNWSVAVRMIRDTPFFGTGLAAYGSVFPAYRTPGVNESRSAHCTWLQLVAELGLGVIPLLVLAAAGGVALARRGARAGPLARAGAIGAVAFLIQNAGDFTFYQPGVGALFVLALALATAELPSEDCTGSADLEKALSNPRNLPRAIDGVLAVAAAVAAGAVLVASGLSGLAMEQALVAHGVDDSAERAALRRAARLDPLDPEPHTDLARVLSGSPDPHERDLARAEAERACRLDPRTAYRWWDLARIELAVGRPALAWTHASRASSLYPLEREYHDGALSIRSRLFGPRKEGG